MDGVTVVHDDCARRDLMWRQIDSLLADAARFTVRPFTRQGRPDVTLG